MKLLAVVNVALFGTDQHDIDHFALAQAKLEQQQQQNDPLHAFKKKPGFAGPSVNAVLCRDGRIAEIGTTEAILARVAKLEVEEPGAEPVVIDGADYAAPGGPPPLLAPAFVDGHAHVLDGGGRLTYVADMSVCRSKDSFIAAARAHVQEQAAAAPGAAASASEWVFGSGWDDERLGEAPSAAWLDAAEATRPACLYRCDFHSAVVNTAALRIAGITRDTADPPGGVVCKDAATGEPTGLLRDTAIDLVRRHFPLTSERRLEGALRAATASYHRYGVTCVHDMTTMDRHTNPAEYAFYRRMLRAGALRLRMRTSVRARELDEARNAGLLDRDGDADVRAEAEMLRLTFVKMFTDGSLGSRTARMAQPYAPRVSECASVCGQRVPPREDCTTCECGIFITHFDDLSSGTRAARQAGLIPAAHAIGDAAVTIAVDALLQPGEDIRPECVKSDAALAKARAQLGDGKEPSEAAAAVAAPPSRARVAIAGRIEHCQHILLRDLERLRGSSVVASMQPLHMASDAIVAERVLGQWRRHGAFPLATMLRHMRIAMAFGSDWPVVDHNPLRTIHAACTRRSHWAEGEKMGVDSSVVPSGNAAWEPRQCLTLREAMEAHTAGAAESAGDGVFLGRVRPGFAADLVLLSPQLTQLFVLSSATGANPLRDDPTAGEVLLDSGAVLKTFLGGECVYSASEQ